MTRATVDFARSFQEKVSYKFAIVDNKVVTTGRFAVDQNDIVTFSDETPPMHRLAILKAYIEHRQDQQARFLDRFWQEKDPEVRKIGKQLADCVRNLKAQFKDLQAEIKATNTPPDA